MKTIFRTRLTADFVCIPNKLAQDTRLSFKARGVLIMILSLPTDWEVHKGWIQSQGKEGKEAINSAVEELKSLGYCKLEKQRDTDGTFIANVWHFADCVSFFPSNETKTVENPESGLPEGGKPAATKDTLNKNILNITIPENLRFPEFESEWGSFRDMRKRKRAPLTGRAAELILSRLSEHPDRAVVALQEAIMRNWTGFDWNWMENGVSKNGRNGSNGHKQDGLFVTR